MSNEEFLVQSDAGRFIAEVDGVTMTVTSVPSAAAHFDSYTRADALCQRLRKRGHRQAIVTDIVGNPIDRAAILGIQERYMATLPKTKAELDRLPCVEYKKRFETESAFRQRAEELERPPAVSR
jgi:hypothetical protein